LKIIHKYWVTSCNPVTYNTTKREIIQNGIRQDIAPTGACSYICAVSYTGWLGVKIMCPSGPTYRISVHCCFGEQILRRSTSCVCLVQWTHHYVIKSNLFGHDVAQKLLNSNTIELTTEKMVHISKQVWRYQRGNQKQ
jgi:hypothetical protein